MACRTQLVRWLWDSEIAGFRGRILQRMEAERWQRALDSPLEGVPFTYEEFADALSNYDFSFEIGDLVRGVVFKTDFNGALIDLGAKASAYLPLSESCIHKVKSVEEVGLYPGTEEEFMIVQEDDGRVIVSLRKLQYDISWERCRQLQADDCPVRGKVLSANRGGIVVRVVSEDLCHSLKSIPE
ncbi:hypothetical protein Mapa_009208 [Marchantia paleacea]|nr:hypothetical protein Mapa_009208 [Marchantia paleacea]